MKLTVVQQGRLKDPAVAGMVAEYVKRFRAYGRLAVVEVPKPKQDPWPAGIGRRIALDERGTSCDSHGLAARLATWTERHGSVAFMVGDADGLWEESRAGADELLSLSPLTLPHRLAHLVLVEQLYRAASIAAGHPYHRD